MISNLDIQPEVEAYLKEHLKVEAKKREWYDAQDNLNEMASELRNVWKGREMVLTVNGKTYRVINAVFQIVVIEQL